MTTSHTIQDAILTAIESHGPGYVFTPKDLLAVAKRGMVDVTLGQLQAKGVIRKVIRGVYELPKRSVKLGTYLSTDIDQLAKALARRFGWRIVPSGAHAANMLGLSTQVPAKAIYLTDGPTKRVPLGKRELIFQTARPKDFAGDAAPEVALFIQAVKHLGREEALSDATIALLREKLDPSLRKRLPEETRYVTDWVYELAKWLAQEAKR